MHVLSNLCEFARRDTVQTTLYLSVQYGWLMAVLTVVGSHLVARLNRPKAVAVAVV